jgi:fatty acid desaturase
MTVTLDAPENAPVEMSVSTPVKPAKGHNASKIPLTPEQLDAFGAEMDGIRQRTVAKLGDEDAAYIRKIVKWQRGLEVAGRVGFYVPPLWPAAVASLGVSKILDNMEIGHNVMHGQYDWMGDPGLNSRVFDWDTMAPAENWKHGHNYVHHTYTNIVGKDRDVGYGILRMDPDQKWHPYYLGNMIYAFLLMTFFEWGVMAHDLEVEEVFAGRRSMFRGENGPVWRKIRKKVSKQVLKDYVVFPLLTGPFFLTTLAGNAIANLIRNVWTFSIIFCGHFPAGVASFSIEECEDESRGHWYYRQLLGSANITGGKLFHVMSGNLSHQIEHHLFPDVPARRYPEMAVEVREVCNRYGLQYNQGSIFKQLATVYGKIFRLSFPTRTKKADVAATSVAQQLAA